MTDKPRREIELDVQGVANLFLSDRLPDRFLACRPKFDASAGVWRLDVLLTYATLGPVGKVGEIVVDAWAEEVVSHTPLDEMKERARALYEQNREAIERPLV